jgi:hypothetical protein
MTGTSLGIIAMLNHPDPLLEHADIAAVAAESGLSREVIERVHAHLTDLQGEPPTRGQLRAYVTDVGGSLGEGGLRLYFGMQSDPAHPTTPRVVRLVEAMADEVVVRRRGRPAWTAGEFHARYLDACGRATPPFTPRSIAPHFDILDGNRGTDPDYLRKLIRRFGPSRIPSGADRTLLG